MSRRKNVLNKREVAALKKWPKKQQELRVQTPDFERIGQEVGLLVEKKNQAYGDSFNKCDEFLRLLYPQGVKPEQYGDMLTLVRMFDKMMRIAVDKDALGESPYTDLVGYSILGVAYLGKKEKKT